MSNLSDLKPGIWNVDASHSEVGFTARHLMVSRPSRLWSVTLLDVKVIVGLLSTSKKSADFT